MVNNAARSKPGSTSGVRERVSPTSGSEQAASPTVLLVVEDDFDHRETVREILEEEGYLIEVAAHGGEALDLLTLGSRPDLILLDLMMPEMDGWAFMTQLRRLKALTSIPVVMISGAGDKVLSSAPVAAGYLSKPLDRRRLLETIELCLLRRGSIREP